MFEIKCELDVVREEKLGGNIYHTGCYRYDIDGNKVVFTQTLEFGSVSMVSIRKNEKLKNADIDMFVDTAESADIYYPQNIEIYPHFRFDYTDTDKYIEALQYAKELAQAIMSIFDKDSRHWELYQKMKG